MSTRSKRFRCIVVAASIGVSLPLASTATSPHDGWLLPERIADWANEQPAYGQPPRGQGSYGSSERYGNESGGWAIGTFRGRNGATGNEEIVTIRPDGTAELRARDQPPRYGSFAGETLTFDSRMSRVQPARGGIVIDGAYYSR